MLEAECVKAQHLYADALQTADFATDANGNPTSGARMISATAAPEWSSATTYPGGALVSSGGNVYRSLQASNANHTPASSPTWWKLTPTLQVEPGGLQIGAYRFAQRFEATQLTLPAGQFSVTWTFATAEPDTNYLVIVTAVNSWNAATPNCQVVVSAIKNTGSLQIITAGAPGAGGGVLFDVVKFRL